MTPHVAASMVPPGACASWRHLCFTCFPFQCPLPFYFCTRSPHSHFRGPDLSTAWRKLPRRHWFLLCRQLLKALKSSTCLSALSSKTFQPVVWTLRGWSGDAMCLSCFLCSLFCASAWFSSSWCADTGGVGGACLLCKIKTPSPAFWYCCQAQAGEPGRGSCFLDDAPFEPRLMKSLTIRLGAVRLYVLPVRVCILVG